MSAFVSKLRVADQDFLIASLIERCPKIMMTRELVKNAIEAAAQSRDGDAVVRVSAVPIDGVVKLAIWNAGPGLTAAQMDDMCDLASSINKVKGLDANFGMGAKVASLPSNQHGMRYRSCRGGQVHEVVLGKREGTYGRVMRPAHSSGPLRSVLDVTASERDTGRALERDWTEVVLMGNWPGQNTVADPFDGDPAMPADWLALALYERFYRLPPEVRIEILDGAPKRGGSTRFLTVAERIELGHFTRHEAVRMANGIVVHYVFDAPDPADEWHNQSGRGAMQADWSHAAVVFRDEMYDVLSSGEWTSAAPQFGIQVGARRILVHVELPDTWPVRPDAYRQFLSYTGADQGRVELLSFADLVSTGRPPWLRDIIDGMMPDVAFMGDVRDQLGALLRLLEVRRMRPGVTVSEGSEEAAPLDSVAPDATDWQAKATSTPDAGDGEKPAPSELTIDDRDLASVPDLVFLRDEREIAERWLRGRAARYYPETNSLFFNMTYIAIDRMSAALRDTARALTASPAEADSEARSIAERAIALRVGRALVYALTKRAEPDDWQDWQLERAMSPEALTLAADDYASCLVEARSEVTRRLTTLPGFATAAHALTGEGAQ